MADFVNLAFEHALINSVFRYHNQYKQIISKIDSTHFANHINGKIFDELCRYEREFSDIPSLPFFKQWLFKDRSPEEQLKFQAELNEIATASIKEDEIPPLCDELGRMKICRNFLSSCRKYIGEITSDNVKDVLSEFDGRLRSLLNSMDIKRDDMTSLLHDIDKRIEHLKSGDSGIGVTGVEDFDNAIPKIPRGALVIYQARTNVGKTMFMMSTALKNFHDQKLNVIYITIEMSDKEVAYRMDSNITELDHEYFVKGDILKDQTKIDGWRKSITDYVGGRNDLKIFYVPDNCTPNKVESIITEVTDKWFAPDVVVIDYAGDMKAGIRGLPDHDPKAQAEIYSRLKEIAGKHRCVIFTAQQVKRGTKGKDITTEDGAWSDVASSKADLMISIREDADDELLRKYYPDTNIIKNKVLTLKIFKNRLGRNEIMTKIWTEFYKMRWIKYQSKDDQADFVKSPKNENVKEESIPDLNAGVAEMGDMIADLL